MVDDAARRAEFVKYDRAYTHPKYRMKKQRFVDAVADLKALPCRNSYLDVSCGQGDMLDRALTMGFPFVKGTEIVPKLIDGDRVIYAEVHALPFPDKSFEVVSLFDVIEHLVPGDDEAACRELARVATRFVLLTANNKPSYNKAGDDLHINRRPYVEWDSLFRRWFPGKVEQLPGHGGALRISECWRVTL